MGGFFFVFQLVRLMTSCNLSLRKMFREAAHKNGEQGIVDLRACVVREAYTAARAAMISIGFVAMTERQVLKRMKSKETYVHTMLSLNLSCDAFIPLHTQQTGDLDGAHSLKHKSGWEITGEAAIDYYCFCISFKAVHKKFGAVWAEDLGAKQDRNHRIMATSKAAMDSFWLNHSEFIELVDYGDV